MSVNKKGAIELSIGTIVIIVLAMSMLILGMVLVKNIFSGSTQNIVMMNDQVKDQINKLFVEDKRTVVYLPNQIAEIKQNEQWGVGFAIKNLEKGTADVGQFQYQINVDDPQIQQKCGISITDAEQWIIAGQSTGEPIDIAPGQIYYGIVRFRIPDTSPLCIIRFNLKVTRGGTAYATDFFDVEVVS